MTEKLRIPSPSLEELQGQPPRVPLPPLKVGLLGMGRVGSLVAQELSEAPDVDLRWVVRRNVPDGEPEASPWPVLADDQLTADWLQACPVDVVVDFSSSSGVKHYGLLADAGCCIVSAVSRYEAPDLAVLHALAQRTGVMHSPNITVGINFVLVASRLLRRLAPHADVEIIEEHFRNKPEVSGTALKLAKALELSEEQVHSVRVGGIVGRHQVVFGFPNQTIR